MHLWSNGIEAARPCKAFRASIIRGSGFYSRGGTADQAVHPVEVGKLIAVNKQRVTTAEDCGR
jgi:hypothetical protein